MLYVALWCFTVPCPALMCLALAVLCSLGARYLLGQNHITQLCSSAAAVIQTRAAYCCRHPAGPAISATSPLSLSMSHKPSFSTDFSGFQPQFGRTYRPILVFQELTDQYWSFKKRLRTESRHHLCAVEMRRTIKRGGLGRLIEFTVFPDCPSWEHLSFLCTSIEIPLGSC